MRSMNYLCIIVIISKRISAQVEVEEDANVEVAADEKDAEQDAEGAAATHCVRLRDANIMKTLGQELTCDFYLDGEGGADEDDLDPEDEKVDVEPESRQEPCRPRQRSRS